MATWKSHERRVATRLGGERIPVSDRRSDADVLHPSLSIECKLRKSLPNWLHSAMTQAQRAHADKIPIVVLHELGRRSDDDYVVMRMADFETLIVNRP